MELRKNCLLCGKEFLTDTKHNDVVCSNIHYYQCKNCGNEVTITKQKDDWYKRNMILKQGQVFCNNKCSIQYNQDKKFVERYKNDLEQIRNDYENTSIPKNDIATKYKMSVNTLNKIINKFDMVRSTSLEYQMYSEKSKKQNSALTETQKLQRNLKLKQKTQAYWDSLSKRQRKELSNKIWSNRTEDDIKEITDKIHQTKLKNNSYGKSKEEDKLYDYLVLEFGKDNVIRQYSENGFIFDFKIIRPSLSKQHKGEKIVQLVELNGSYYHNFRPYKDCLENNNEYNKMIECGGQAAKIAKKWRYTDIDKYNYCKEHNINFVCIYFDRKPKPYFTNEELIKELDQLKKLKSGYTNISSHNKIIDNFCYDLIYKNTLKYFNDDSIIFPYLVNRIKYVGNYGEGCYRISMLKLLKDFNKYHSMNESFSSHQVSNIQTFIDNYNIQSIADPFAGWGQRMLGAVTRDCNYIGCDVNKNQFKNLLNIKHFIEKQINNTHINLYNLDSSTINKQLLSDFNYDAIFTCPPYWNTELYSEFGIENYDYNKFKSKFKEIFDLWTTSTVKVIGIQFTERYEDCIKQLGYNYEKIPITKSKHHLTNKKYNEFIYIIEKL